MSKLKERLSKWFLNIARRIDKDTFKSETTVLPQLPEQNFIVYDRFHTDKIRGQYSISSMEMKMRERYKDFNLENEIHYRIAQGIAEEIMKLYGDQINVEYKVDMDTQVYSLDVYVCKPQKKERL